MKELLQKKIDQFNEKAASDLKGVTRSVLIEISDGPCYTFMLDNARISDFKEGTLDNPDVRIISDTATLKGIIRGEIGPMKAFVTKKLKFKAPIEDLLRLRKLFK